MVLLAAILRGAIEEWSFRLAVRPTWIEEWFFRQGVSRRPIEEWFFRLPLSLMPIEEWSFRSRVSPGTIQEWSFRLGAFFGMKRLRFRPFRACGGMKSKFRLVGGGGDGQNPRHVRGAPISCDSGPKTGAGCRRGVLCAGSSGAAEVAGVAGATAQLHGGAGGIGRAAEA